MKYIPYGHQSIDQSDIEEVVKVLKADWLTQGSKVKEFEDVLSKYTGAKYAVAVSSGTAALHLACLAAGIKEGDEVITSPITFMASANCILYCGGKPVFIDIELDTGNINPQKINQYLRTMDLGHRTQPKAVIPVHYSGHPCNMEAIYKIAKENDLTIIEDAAHALGAEYKGDKIGSCKYSDMTTFSFHPVKSITTGEGGTITTNNKEYYEKLLMLRQHGITKDPSKFFNEDLSISQNAQRKTHNSLPWYHEMQMLGFNYRLTDFQCALGISQLKKLDKFIQRRSEIAGIYNDAFKDNEFFDLPIEKDYAKSSWHLYPIRLKDKYKESKTLIFNKLREKGLGVQVHYIPVYLQSYYKKLGYDQGSCLKAKDFYKREISLPIYPAMSDEDIGYIVQVIKGLK